MAALVKALTYWSLWGEKEHNFGSCTYVQMNAL